MQEQPQFIDRRASSKPEADETKEQETNPTDNSLADQLAEEKEKAQSFYASWQRAAADHANYKRRVEQERQEVAQFSNAALIINLLPLIDDLERALDNVDSRLAGMTWLDGIRLIHRKFKALLEMSGVEEIAADGQAFDPNVHEAVMHADGPEGRVVGVAQKGYTLGGRVLRPAMVVVGNGGGTTEESRNN